MEIIIVKWFDVYSKLEVLEKDDINQKVKARHIGHYAENWYDYSECLNYTQLLWISIQNDWSKMTEKEIHETNKKYLSSLNINCK